ncbi:MAG: methionyl-tRNA formyltransferase [Actinobacteria bacterium]|jgi:methionyl-tRNA formyltransferase|nr:methionyl-tRNA formyltransferase [Actinomycetota bacterium]MBT3747189.1 methionyl-tRNA formyltransferase [Actinomycetota bacterium]MBT3969986.1 methionyl-tRNA formyltransferase [Actinomycetota bacterium]MBT4008884.1 methionyl-tRNA formyltransferase [Actinomycetota bacterium]MBT4303963.1 methionyl-tRNA formyltransferase [Actinomycetota bacterium]
MTAPQRLVYLGTPQAAVPPLEALCAAGFDIVQVITGPDKRRGRRAELSPSPVKEAAQALGLPVAHELDALNDCSADLGVVVAYGKLLPMNLLQRIPMVNLHFSLLPKWRGAAPVERSLLAGDANTGVCVMEVAQELDTGGIYAKTEVAIGQQTARQLRQKLVKVGSELLTQTLLAGLGAPVPQDGTPSYAHKITTEDRHLNWNHPAEELLRQVRLGGAWTTFRGQRFKIWVAETGQNTASDPGTLHHDHVATGQGTLRLIEVQAENKARQPWDTWQTGARLTDQDRLI